MEYKSNIDLVIPMVFPQDSEWQKSFAEHSGNAKTACRNERYRSWGTEDLLIRCCRKYMPWLRKIHILLASESQRPFLKEADSPKVVVHYHGDFIPGELLPCFNVNTIEMFLHNIPGLSEYLIYSNDDFFPLSPLAEEDFFGERDGMVMPCQHMVEKRYPASPTMFHKFVKAGLDMVAADFGAKYSTTWLRGAHTMQPMLLSTVRKVRELHDEAVSRSFTFARSDKNYNQYIYPYYQHLSGLYIDRELKHKYIGGTVSVQRIVEAIRAPDVGVVCLNDTSGIPDWKERAAVARKEIEAKLNQKSGMPHKPIDVLIVHYNTPELTAATIQSVRKHTPGCRFTVFDNSDKNPFVANGKDITYIDNTKGQIVNWDKWLSKFPDKAPNTGNHYGSAKHCYSVELCMDRFPDGFILADSDILVKQDISVLADPGVAFTAGIHTNTVKFGVRVYRACPFLCWINTPMLRRHGIRYFNPDKMWYLTQRRPDMYYDTGAWLLESVRAAGLPERKVDLKQYIEHLGHASWHVRKSTSEWLRKHRDLWEEHPDGGWQTCAQGAPVASAGTAYTVLTYIFGSYECIHEVEAKDPDATYILVTDNPNLRSRTWEIVFEPLEGMNATDKAKYVKYHPFKYARTELVIRLDGSIGVRQPLREFIGRMQQGGYDRCLMIHPRRNLITTEYKAWVRGRGLPQQVADKCMEYMRQHGYSMGYRGLFQTCFEIVRRNSVNDALNRSVYDILLKLGDEGHVVRVDQTVLTFVVNNKYSRRLKVLPVSERIVTDGRLMTWYRHNSNAVNHSSITIDPVMFNRPVRVWSPNCP